MNLKERILKEMVIDKEMFEEVISTIDHFPIELQTYKTFKRVEELFKLKESLDNTPLDNPLRRTVINDMIELRLRQLKDSKELIK